MFKPQPRKQLTILTAIVPSGVLCRGICEDETIMTNCLFSTYDKAVQTIGEHYSARGYRCVFQRPKADNENPPDRRSTRP